MLKTGDRAPAFSLVGDDDKKHTLQDFAGKNLILYFYPKNATPGCTIEACDFRQAKTAFGKRDAIVVGVSPDPVSSHQKWQDKEHFGFLLLSDPNHAVASKYGAWGDKVLYGKKYKGIIRSTFIIDADGKIASAEYKVSPKGHAQAVLKQLSEDGIIAHVDPEAAAKKPAKATKQTK